MPSPRSTIAISVLLSALVAFAVTRAAAPVATAPTAAASESVFDRVMRTGTIRCGYFIAKELIMHDDKTGHFSGPAFELTELLAKNLGLKTEWVAEVGLASMAQDLKQGRYDMICTPLSINGVRGKVLSFSRPLFAVPLAMWVHKDDAHQGGDTAWLNDPSVTIAAIDGIAFGPIIKRLFPQAQIYGLPEMTPLPEQMTAVATHKAIATMMTLPTGSFYASQNDHVVKPVSDTPVAFFNYHYPLPQGDERFRGMINAGLDEIIANGSLDVILDRYETAPPSFFWRLQSPYHSPKE